MWIRLRAFTRSWGIALLIVAAGLAIAASFVAPAPPRVLRFATGPGPESAYSRAVEAYAVALRREGFRVEMQDTRGSIENLALLRERKVDLALVQGGAADPARDAGLQSLGAVFPEPVWVFLRRAAGITRIAELRGRRVAIGPEGSGTRALGLALLRANDIDPADLELRPETGLAAAEALIAGQVDLALFVVATPGAGINRLIRAGDVVELVDFGRRAEAYARALPYLTPVALPQGGVSIAEDLPAAPLTLLAPAASLVTHEDIHPQVVSLMVRILQEVHGGRQPFAAPGRFPSPQNQDLPLHQDAQRYYARGPGFLQSWLPFWVAVAVERLWVLLIPIFGLAVPLLRIAPAIYSWQMGGRIWRHYEALRRIEAAIADGVDAREREELAVQLAELDRRVASTGVPAAFRRHVYALRRDIADVRSRLAAANIG